MAQLGEADSCGLVGGLQTFNRSESHYRLVTNRVHWDNGVKMETVGTTRLSFLDRLRDRSTQRGWLEFDERYRELLIRYAQRRGASSTEAEDIAQEVELSLFKAMDRFQYDKGRGKFRSYLRTAVIHALARRVERNAHAAIAVEPDVLVALADIVDEADAEWEREWQLHRLRWCLRSIAKEFEPLTLEAFRLHVLAGWTVESTAELLSMSEASIYQAKSRVLKRLKARLATTDPDEDEGP